MEIEFVGLRQFGKVAVLREIGNQLDSRLLVMEVWKTILMRIQVLLKRTTFITILK